MNFFLQTKTGYLMLTDQALDMINFFAQLHILTDALIIGLLIFLITIVIFKP
jgi:type III secretory pathway component EscV